MLIIDFELTFTDKSVTIRCNLSRFISSQSSTFPSEEGKYIKQIVIQRLSTMFIDDVTAVDVIKKIKIVILDHPNRFSSD